MKKIIGFFCFFVLAFAAQAAELNFKATGQGAIDRPVAEKLGDVINALDYATGDGVTDDTAALRNAIAAVPSRGTLYFGCGNYVVSGTGSEVFFRDKPINLVANGNCARIDVSNVSTSTDLFRFVPSEDFDRGWSVVGLEIVRESGRPMRHFLHFDTTTNDITYFTAVNIENNRVQPIGGNAVYTNNAVTNIGGGFHTSRIIRNSFNNPVWLNNAGDHILISDNVMSGQSGFHNPCIYFNLTQGAGNLRIIGNVMSCRAGMIIGDAGAATVIAFNILEQHGVNSEADNSLINFRGNERPIDAATVIGNQITVPSIGDTGDPIPIYIGKAERVIVNSNQFRTTKAYPNVVVSPDAVDTVVGFNQYGKADANPVSVAGTNTTWLRSSNVATVEMLQAEIAALTARIEALEAR